MIATLSSDGKVMLPSELRETAQLEPGDTLQVQYYKGTIVLRKHRPLTSEQCATLLERSRSQPKPTPEDNAAMEQAIGEARADYLVTGDKGHLLSLRQVEGVLIVAASDFLRFLGVPENPA